VIIFLVIRVALVYVGSTSYAKFGSMNLALTKVPNSDAYCLTLTIGLPSRK